MSSDLDKRLSLDKRIEKMMSLGIWDDKLPQPDPLTLERIQKLNDDIEDQIYELYLPNGKEDPKVAEIKRQMYEESRETKAKKEKVQTEKQTQNKFLGKGVSAWLGEMEENTERLKQRKLPSIPTSASLAKLLDMTEERLRWLSYHREITSWIHYTEFTIQKGKKTRRIASPNQTMRAVQKIIKEEILDKLNFESYVHGFRKGHNILDNAREHSNARSLVTIDIRNFFGNVNFYMVRAGFHRLGYSREISTYLALLTTKPRYQEIKIGDQTYWACSPRRYLPQGATTSPGISNMIASRFDRQLYERANGLGFIYTRYADDLTFSTKKPSTDHRKILYMARRTLEIFGLEAHPDKVKILFPHHRQEVTGLILNEGTPKVSREWRKRVRAAVHQFRFIEDDDEQAAEHIRLTGSIQHLKLSHPRLAQQYKIEIDRYLRKN
ncbi:MAG: reverse transcriptase family protein [Candidatus Kariarchaeaceae archaeon]|jgi:hypothetical protein